MAKLAGYFDAAGDNRGEYAVTVGGYVSPVRSWSRFRRDWRKILDPLGIEVFHTTDFVAGESDFKDWKNKPTEQMALLKRLAAVVVKHAHYSPASTVFLHDWHEINREYTLQECHATPYAIASFTVLNKSIRWIGKVHPHDRLEEFVFEDGDSGRGDFLHFMNWVREVAKDNLAKQVYPVFKPKSLAPLQAADLVSWEQRFVASRRLQGRIDGFRASIYELLKVAHDWSVINKSKIIEWCEWCAVPKRDSSAHLSQKERARWRPAPFEMRKRGQNPPTREPA